MPKGSDPQCPLGFHPQFRRPNYCKRCFREYGDHKQAGSGSNTSINSLSFDRKDDLYGSRDSITSSRNRDEVEGFSRSRSDLTSSSFSRSNSEEETRGPPSRSRPMSWSAQDLRKAVDDAKENTRSRDDTYRSYGNYRSVTQDLGSLEKLRDGPSLSAKEKEDSKYSREAESAKSTSSFSSYLSMKNKTTPARPSLSRTSSLPGSQPLSTLKEEPNTELPSLRERPEPKWKATSSIKEETKTELSSIKERSEPKWKSSLKEEPKTELPTLKEKSEPKWKTSSSLYSSNLKGESIPSKYSSRGRADRPSLPNVSETEASGTIKEDDTTSRRSVIQCLREVKSEDADAAYVIHLKPKVKKENSASKKVEIDLQPEVERLRKEMKELTQKIKELEDERDSLDGINKELMTKKPRFGDIKKQADVTKLQQKVDELNDEIKGKSKDVKDMKKELQKRPLPKDVENTMEDLRSKLQAAEQLCEELMDENEEFKKEVRTLEDEIEEMQDNFREDQADEYRDLKRELEQRAKDCRVLQFKLKKAERRTDQLERDKGDVEHKLNEIQVGETDPEKAERLSALEKELNLAKEVSVKMHEEMNKMKDQLEVAEKDKKMLKEKVQDTPMKVPARVSRSQMMGRQGSQDNTEQILRDLQDSQEREQDMKEQLKYAEEETKNVRKKLSRIEEENETLQLQLNKMSAKARQSRQRSMERTGSFERSSSVERGSLSRQGSTEKPHATELVNGEELDPTELKIQLELNEQESVVQRRKIEDLETDNHRLQKELKELLTSMAETKNIIGRTDYNKLASQLHERIRSIEQELSVSRKKVSEVERERDQIKVDLDSARKRNRTTRTRSTEQTDDDTESLRNKVKELESSNDTLLEENKRLQLQTQKRLPLSVHEKMYIDNQVLEDKIKRVEKKLKESNDKLKNNTLQQNSDLVDGLSKDSKIEEMQAKIEELQEKYDKVSKDNQEFKSSTPYDTRKPRIPKEFTPKSTLVKWVNELEEECSQLHSALRGHKGKRETAEDIDLQDKLQREKERNDELTRQLQEERDKLFSEKKSYKSNDVKIYEERIQSLRKELKDDRNKIEEFEKKMAEGSLISIDKFRMMQKENKTLQKEIFDSKQTLSILEQKLKEKEETLTISEKAEKNLRSLLQKADQKENLLTAEKTRREQAEDRGREERDEKRRLHIERDQLRCDIESMKASMYKAEANTSDNKRKLEKEIDQLRKEREDCLIRMTTLESELKMEKKKRERLEADKNYGLQGRTSELESYKDKLAKLELDKTRISIDLDTIKKENGIRIKGLERNLSKEINEKEEMRKKHELLEEDYVLIKAQLYESKDGDYASLKKEHDIIEQELKKLRETYNLHQDTWIKEKLDIQIQMKNLEKSSSGAVGYSERIRHKKIIEDKTQQIDNLKTESDSLNNQISTQRREAEDLKKKVDDLEKLQEIADKRQYSSTAGTRQYEVTIKELKSRLSTLEKMQKSEANKAKIRYDAKVKALSEEVSTLTHHMTKYRRERDTYKEMLDGAKKAISELKSGTASGYRTSRADTATEAKAHLNEVIDLQGNVTELEDKLADSKLEITKLKNELVDKKTNFEIQLCDMQTKLNEYEEDRLLDGAARRVPGLRTRLELNWQKEREEQQRIIQDTSSLAKDLRQTLYEVERERDMERIESKRKIEQLKKSVTLDHQDTKGKVHELQRDLLELREAHAKLRQINEKLRREKDRTEVEREAMRDKFLGSSREFLNQQAKMEKLLHELKKLKDIAPLALGEELSSTAPSRPLASKPNSKEDFQDVVKRLTKTSDELRVMMGLGDERDRMRRTPSFRRALSTESDDEGGAVRSRSSGPRGSHRPVPRAQKTQLYRKAQSLDHQMADERGKIWVSTDAGSTSSIESSKTDDFRKYKFDPDSSFDRMSTGSQTSDLDLAGESKSKGKKGVFSMFGKTRSNEDVSSGLGGSGSSLANDSENTVSSKLKTFFKKSATSSQAQPNKDSVKSIAPKFESDTESIGSVSSLDSSSLPPVMQRFQGRFGANRFAKLAVAPRSRSFETNV